MTAQVTSTGCCRKTIITPVAAASMLVATATPASAQPMMTGIGALISKSGSQAGVQHASADSGEQHECDPMIHVADYRGKGQSQRPIPGKA